MTLKYPFLLLLFLIYIPLIWRWIYTSRHQASLSVSSTRAFKNKKVAGRVWMIPLCRVLDLVAIGFLIVSICRPQSPDSLSTSSIEGTDIVISLDISESMSAPDLRPNRMEAAKKTAIEFIQNRTSDNIGLVIFAGEALSVLPLTNDMVTLQNTLEHIKMGTLANGTAIGDGLVSAINRVLNGKAVSKSIILLTDGSNNAGDVAPSIAAEIAQQKGIKVYTIGVGEDGSVVVPDAYGLPTTMETKIDEDVLKEIANKTGGKYFRATDSGTLNEIFKEIDSLEKTKMDVQNFQKMNEEYFPWMLAAFIVFVVSFIIKNVFLVKIP